MDDLQPGHYWKTPFIWEPGCPEPTPAPPALRFEPLADDWLHGAAAAVMADSLDASDRYACDHGGAGKAVDELMAILPEYFVRPDGWWRAAVDALGQRVGFVLPVVFKDRARWREERPQGTIFYMGVLPAFRGRGFGLELVHEATRVFVQAGCWRIFCDTGSDNRPMVEAFRRAGYRERAPWQRPLA
jgi:ribosomal protein S18 acetylase RimI-like enzyme